MENKIKNNILYRRRTRKKWVWTENIIKIKEFDKHLFLYRLRTKSFHNFQCLSNMTLLFLLIVGLFQLPTMKCTTNSSNVVQNSASENNHSFHTNSSVKHINFTNFDESANENEIDYEDLKKVQAAAKEKDNEVEPWKELKQITSVEYSWSEHINVGKDGDDMEGEMIKEHNDIDFYDLLNEINEYYYDLYSNHNEADQKDIMDYNDANMKFSMTMPGIDFDINQNYPTTTDSGFLMDTINPISTTLPSANGSNGKEYDDKVGKKDVLESLPATTTMLDPSSSSSSSFSSSAGNELDEATEEMPTTLDFEQSGEFTTDTTTVALNSFPTKPALLQVKCP